MSSKFSGYNDYNEDFDDEILISHSRKPKKNTEPKPEFSAKDFNRDRYNRKKGNKNKSRDNFDKWN